MKDFLDKENSGRGKFKAYEILAPAGSREALEAAVQNGADAVYLSGKDFGARKFAANFSKEEILDALDYCHERGVSVYVTVNTLLFNQEFEKLEDTIAYYYTIGVDAVIVQDIGVLQLIRSTYPDLDVHCSTQMSVQTVEDIRYLETLGVKRVVLGREMSLKEIRRAKRETNVELEVFIHGALCISLSGQCLMSSMIGGRSGNRGSCAQPCRQKYSLYNESLEKVIASDVGDYLLSPKDLSTAEEITEVIEAGGFSLKIEGRMKKPEYVATVVRIYRQLIEASYGGSINKKDYEKALEDLTIFNRGFTKGHLFGETGRDFMSMKNPGNQGIYIGEIIKQDFSKEKITIALDRDLSHNDEIQLQRKEGTVGARVERLEHQGRLVKYCTKGKSCQVNFKHRVKIGESVYKTFDAALMKEARQTYHKEFMEIPIKGEFIFKEGLPIRGMLTDGKVKVLMESMETPQRATGKSLTIPGLQKQLSKLGGTPYKMDRIDIDLKGELFVPAKEINELRRILVERLGEERIQRYRRDLSGVRQNKRDSMEPETSIHTDFRSEENHKSQKDMMSHEDRKLLENQNRLENNPDTSGGIQLTYSAGTIEQLEKLLELEAKIIYYKDLETLQEAFSKAQNRGFTGNLIPEVYSSIMGSSLDDCKKIISEGKTSTVLIQALGHIPEFVGKTLVGDVSLNILNDWSYQFYQNQGFHRLVLSPELNLQQIKQMNLKPSKTEIIGYGHLPVMKLKHCPISTVIGYQKNCGTCEKSQYSLVDRMDEHYPLLRRNRCNMEVYHSKKYLLIEDAKVLEEAGIGYFRLNFVLESPKEVEQVVFIHRKILKEGTTKESEELLRKIKIRPITKGHLYRGVE